MLVGLTVGGCREREVRAYRVPKEKVAATPLPPAGAAAPTGEARTTALTWTPPDHWQTKPAGGFRRGSFTIPGADGAEADLSIIAFPGDAGGLVENLNRWRGQIGLAAETEAAVQASLEHIDGAGGLHFDVVDYAGTANDAPTRILGAVVNFGGESWFFKMMGPEALVAAEKPAFLAFLHTVKPNQP